MPKHVLAQIQEWKERRGESRLGFEVLMQVDALARLWGASESPEAYGDFIPMRLATILEVYFRESFREVVDAKPEYLRRAEPLLRGLKTDIDILASLHGRTITVGDLVAHNISLSSIESVLAACETLFPAFREKLPDVTEHWTEDAGTRLEPILRDTERTIATVGKMLTVRHIVTHELPNSAPYELDEIESFLVETRDFLAAVDWFLVAETHGDVPRTQAAMNGNAGEMLEKAETRMNDLLAKLKSMEGTELPRLESSQEAWIAFAEADSDWRASLVEGGSMYPMIWATHKAELTEARVSTLRWWVEREEYDL